MLTVQHLNITQDRDLRPLIRDLTFSLSGREHLAVIGEEGDGKSALLKAIVAPEELEKWATVTGLVRADGERIGCLSQDTPETMLEKTVREACGADAAFAALDPGRRAVLCAQTGLDPTFCASERKVRTLSGGEKVKLRLLLCLAAEPTLLLLDEPGNDLDRDALEFLETFIARRDGPVLFVSHDETLLRRAADGILHLESVYGRTEPRWTLVHESYDAYTAERRRAFDRQEQQYRNDRRQERIRQQKLDRLEQSVAYAQENISRADPHGGKMLKRKMKAVKSAERRFEREAEEQTVRPYAETAVTAFFEPGAPLPAGKRVLDLSVPELKAGDRVLARNIELSVRGSERVLITGRNGTGKTTLMRLIRDRLEARTDIRCAYMPQHYEEVLDTSVSPVEFLHGGGEKERLTRIRSALGALKFTREETLRPSGGLSGGQKAKVLLLSLILRDPDVLLLDEPTRNLSPMSAPVVRGMIADFRGAVICVTHDRVLTDTWTGRVLELTADGLVPVRNG